MTALRLSCGREATELDSALDAIEAHLSATGATEAEALQMRLVAEELITNIARCAWPEGEARRFTVETESLAMAEGLSVSLLTIDDGMPFDPTAQPLPDIDAAIETRAIGGLGMVLVKQMTDRQCYRRSDGTNRLVVERLFRRGAGQ